MFKEEITSYCKNCFELEQQLDQNKDRLKAKEQECEELKETIQLQNKMQMEVCEEKNTELDQLKAENDLAKQLINWILKFFELTDYDWQDDQNEISALIEDYIDDKNSTIDFVNDINKGLFKKLTEIKEIAEEKANVNDWLALEILQKISECEGNDE
jgi:chromosome segregation ATPase